MREDPDRLAELRRLLILDSAPERAYDDITRALSTALGAPIAMINLLDRRRDWFKSVIGFPVNESPAATSFCERFFYSTADHVVIPDTTLDPKFSTHPLVCGEPFVRFYAAGRLKVRGQTVGTLCAYDLKPHPVSVEQLQHLQSLSAAVIELLEKRLPRGPARR